MRPRVGHIQFLNCLPLYYGLVKNGGILDLDLVKGTPTRLNAALVAGELDISPISSIEYARHADDLILLPGPTVSCRGPVLSILLLSRFPLSELDGKRITLTAHSATSHVLLKIILARHGVAPRYRIDDTSPGEMRAGADAVLLIGDDALANLEPPAGWHAFDLGSLWRELTGRGMVFAVWAARRDFAERSPELSRHVWKLFKESLDYSIKHIHDISSDAARWELYDNTFLEDYFNRLTFGLEADLQEGLAFFFDEAQQIGELDATAPLRFLPTVVGEAACSQP